MANDNTIGNNPLLNGALGAGNTSTSSVKKSNDKIGKDEFLQMLVTQLKYQDPLDPVKNDRMAVDLAQFSSLEQLVGIRQSLEGGQQGDIASLSGYLGTEVTLNTNTVSVKDHDGGRIRMTLPNEATNVKVELLNLDGSVKETVNLGPAAAGKHSVVLSDLQTGSGEYTFRVVATGLSGAESEVAANTAGIVTGFIPGADPSLIVGNKMVKPGDVQEVNLAG